MQQKTKKCVSSSPSARLRTASAWKASEERCKGCCSWRPRPRDGMQYKPEPDRRETDLSSTKKIQWVGWTVNSTEWGPIKKWLPEACKADFLLAHGRFGCRGVVDAIARMAGGRRASALSVGAALRVGLHQADGAQQKEATPHKRRRGKQHHPQQREGERRERKTTPPEKDEGKAAPLTLEREKAPPKSRRRERGSKTQKKEGNGNHHFTFTFFTLFLFGVFLSYVKN